MRRHATHILRLCTLRCINVSHSTMLRYIRYACSCEHDVRMADGGMGTLVINVCGILFH